MKMEKFTYKSALSALLILSSASAFAEYDPGYQIRQQQAAQNARDAARAYQVRQDIAAQNARDAARAYQVRQDIAAQNARDAARAYQVRQDIAAQNAREAARAYQARQNSNYSYGGSSSYRQPTYVPPTPRYTQSPVEYDDGGGYYYGGGQPQVQTPSQGGNVYIDEYGQAWRVAPSAQPVQPARPAQSQVVQSEPQEYEYQDYNATARLKLTVPQGSQVKFDGNTTNHYDGKIDMSWSDPQPKKNKKVKIEITLDKDGFLYTLNYPATIQTGTVVKGTLDFTDPKVREYFKEFLTIKDRYADTLSTKTKEKKDSLDAWHKTQGEALARRDEEIRNWHAGLIKSLADEPESIRTTLTPGLDLKRDEAMGAVDSATSLFTEEYARRKKVVEEASASVVSLRASGKSVTEVEKAWNEALKTSDLSDFLKKLDSVLSDEKKARTEYPLSTLLGKERTIHNYTSTTLANWRKSVEAVVESWKAERMKDTVAKYSAEISRWSATETARIAKVEDKYIRELAQKAHDAELEVRRQLIPSLEAEIEAEAVRRLAAYQIVYDAYAKEYREKQVIQDAKNVEAQTMKSEESRKATLWAAVTASIDTERKRQADYTPAEKLILSETGIRDYRIAKHKELEGITQQIEAKAAALSGDRADALVKWKEEWKAEVDAIVHKPVRLTIAKLTALESQSRSDYENIRAQKIEAFRTSQKEVFSGFFDVFVNEYRQNVSDARVAPSFEKAKAELKAQAESLEKSLVAADSKEGSRRTEFGSIAEKVKAEEARYPLAVALPKAAAGKYFLGYELSEKHSLFSVNEAGERKLLATFDEGAIHDAVASEGSLLLLAKGIRQISAERALSESSNVQPEVAIESTITTLLDFDDGKLTLVHQPELAGGVYRRVWLGEEGSFLINLEKDKETFTLQLEKDASNIDIVETKEAKSQEAGLFQRSP